MPPFKKGWVLTQDAFDQLLLYLDMDRELAAERYEELRQMLITFFEFRGLFDPEEHADETLNRVARRLSEGQEIPAANTAAYFYAVARNVWREQIAKPAKVVASLEELRPADVSAADPVALQEQDRERYDLEQRLTCLERCLSTFPTEARELISRYYQGEKDAKIKARRDLAERCGIALNALRIRMCRLRDKLEDCVRDCLKRLTVD